MKDKKDEGATSFEAAKSRYENRIVRGGIIGALNGEELKVLTALKLSTNPAVFARYSKLVTWVTEEKIRELAMFKKRKNVAPVIQRLSNLGLVRAASAEELESFGGAARADYGKASAMQVLEIPDELKENFSARTKAAKARLKKKWSRVASARKAAP